MTGGERRLLALCGIIIPFCLIYILKFSVLSAILLCVILGVSIVALKIARNGAQRNPPVTSRVINVVKLKSHETETGLVKNVTDISDRARSISPVSPCQRSPLKEAEYLQRSGYNGHHDYPPTAKSKHYVPLSPILMTDFAPPKTFSKTQSPTPGTSSVYALPVFSDFDKNSRNFSASLARSPLSSARSSLVSPPLVNNSFVNLSPQSFRPISKNQVQPNYTKAAMFPLSNRHYPTHQPDYAQTNMGILPASSIFYGDGAANSLTPLRRGGGVRTHSPVTVKIARPDNRRSASPLFRRLSLERGSGSPLHKDMVIAALNEKRKRVAIEEHDGCSSVASSALLLSAGGGMLAKRRRLDNGSRCSTPSIGGSSNYSAMINGDMPSDSSADEATNVRVSWAGARGLQSRTPRNPIDSSISSSRRAALENQMMRKRMLIQPANPESSPSKKVSLLLEGVQKSPTDKTLPSNGPRSITNSEIAKRNGEPGPEGRGVIGGDRSSSSEDGPPTTTPGKNPLAARLKTPKLRMLGHQGLKNSSPPVYTAADLEEDRHLDKQRVNYILESLKDGEEVDEDKKKNKPKDQHPSKTVSFAIPQTLSISAEPTTVSSPLTATNLLQLSKMNTLPVSEIQKGQLLIPSSKSDINGAVNDNQLPAQSTGFPATSTLQTGAALESGTLGLSTKTAPTTGFLSSGGITMQAGPAAPTSSSTVGFTVVDSSKLSLGQQGSGQTSLAPQKDTILKGMLAGTDHTSAATSTAFQLGGAPTIATPTQISTGNPVGIDQVGTGQAPFGQSLSGHLSQGTPLGGFSLASVTSQPQVSQGGLPQSLTVSSGSWQGSSTTGSSLFSQALGGGSGLTLAAPSSVSSVTTTSSGFQISASSTKPTPAAPSGPVFESTAPGATSNIQSTFQFGASQIPQNIASSGFQLSTKTPVSTARTGGLQFGTVPSTSSATVKTDAQSSSQLQFGLASSTIAKPTAPALSFGIASGGMSVQPSAVATAASSGLFNPTSAPSSSIFGGATATATATKPSFTPAFGQAVSATPAQPSNQSFNFSAQPTGTPSSTTDGFQFKPAFGAPTQMQPSQSQQQQPSNPMLQFGSSMTGSTSNPTAATGGFTFSTTPATNSSSVFGSSATASASPFSTAASSTTGGIFGQQPTTQPSSFGTATAQPANAFGGPIAEQSMFEGQPTAPAPNSGGFNFGTPTASQANPAAFNFGTQPVSQPASSSMYQFGQQTGTSQPMGGFGTPSKPPPYNFGAGAGSGFGTPAPSAAPSFGGVTPAPSAAPSFGGVTPTNQGGGFSLGATGSLPSQKRISRMTRQARQSRRR